MNANRSNPSGDVSVTISLIVRNTLGRDSEGGPGEPVAANAISNSHILFTLDREQCKHQKNEASKTVKECSQHRKLTPKKNPSAYHTGTVFSSVVIAMR